MADHDNAMPGTTPGFYADDFAAVQADTCAPVARIRVADWHSNDPDQRVIRTGRLAVYLDTRMAAIEGRLLHLTRKEYAILELLSLRKGTALTKKVFLDHLYCGMERPETKIIDVFVCKLRRKIARTNDGNHYIETVRGRGYVLNDPPRTPPPVPLADALALPRIPGRSTEVFVDGDLEVRFSARPTNGPQVPHERDELYFVASGTGRYRLEDTVTAVGAGDLLFCTAHAQHGFQDMSDDFSVWVLFYGPRKHTVA